MSTTLEEVLCEARKLPPDERRELAETLLEEGARATAVAGEPYEEKGSAPTAEVRRRRLEWMKAHRAEYGGLHVALDGAARVAVGQSYREAKEKATSSGKLGAFVTYLPKPDEVAEGGGWDVIAFKLVTPAGDQSHLRGLFICGLTRATVIQSISSMLCQHC